MLLGDDSDEQEPTKTIVDEDKTGICVRIPERDPPELTMEEISRSAYYDRSAINPMKIPEADRVMFYFSRSAFYDKQCNNEYCQMQNRDPSHLKNMATGFEYALVTDQDPFIIQKRLRKTETEVVPFAIYYCSQGVIYQAPSILSVLSARVNSSLHHLQEAFKVVKNQAHFHTHQPYTWDINLTNMPAQPITQSQMSEKYNRAEAVFASLKKKNPIHTNEIGTNK